MARPRSLNPSPAAMKMRARRGVFTAALTTQLPLKPPPRKSSASALDQAESLLRESADTPLIPSSATYEDALRLKAVYDARRSRLAAEVEAFRVEMERGRLYTQDAVAARDATRDNLILGQLHAFADFHASQMPPEQQAEARRKAGEWVKDLRAKIAAELEAIK